jgi:CD36 family
MTKWEESLDVEYDSDAEVVDEYPEEYSMNLVNGRTYFPHWKSQTYDSCSSRHNAFDGTMFPRYLQKHKDIKIYRKCMCRTMNIEYVESSFHYGNEFYHYTPKVISDEDCLCKDITCSLIGIGSISTCHEGKQN